MTTRPDPSVERLRQLFASRRPIEADTNFFEAGFTSALLAELLPVLVDAGLAVTLLDLYRYPTVRQLAGRTDPSGSTDQSARSANRLPWQPSAAG